MVGMAARDRLDRPTERGYPVSLVYVEYLRDIADVEFADILAVSEVLDRN